MLFVIKQQILKGIVYVIHLLCMIFPQLQPIQETVQEKLQKGETQIAESNSQVNNNSNNNTQILNNKGIINITTQEQSESESEVSTSVVSKLGEEKLSDGTIKTSWSILLKNAGTQNLYLDYLDVDNGKVDFNGIQLSVNSVGVGFKIEEANKENISCVLHFQNHKKEKFSKKITFKKQDGSLRPIDSKSILES